MYTNFLILLVAMVKFNQQQLLKDCKRIEDVISYSITWRYTHLKLVVQANKIRMNVEEMMIANCSEMKIDILEP